MCLTCFSPEKKASENDQNHSTIQGYKGINIVFIFLTLNRRSSEKVVTGGVI